ncbi:MAG: homoserine dehydrogenase [Akkermansia sp.]|nr:homoserine dehydrogenase [Akkermansia sp.]
MTGETLQIGLAGLGTVGTGVYETLCRNHDLLEARTQIPFAVKRVAVRSLARKRDVEIDPALLTDNWQELVDDPEIDIIIELIGGTEEAYRLVKAALLAHKPVVTGNKALLAEFGSELFQLSAETTTPLYFEASCGGGIPIIQSLQNSLVCNYVRRITGIINGTSNYILSSMERKGMTYEDALAAAQRKGYAEADPTLDVNGWDAAHKALILAMLAYGTPVSTENISVYGIDRITATDFRFAKELGYNIKLLVVIRHHADKDALELRVQPSFVSRKHLLSSVYGVFNAIAVHGDIVGETIFYGRGAGKNPTASAVIGDVMLAMRECRHPENHSGFHPYTKRLKVLPQEETVTPYYVRFLVQDRPGVIAVIAAELAKYDIGISGTMSSPRKGGDGGEGTCDLVFLLHACPWGKLCEALRALHVHESINPHPAVFRIETLNEEA